MLLCTGRRIAGEFGQIARSACDGVEDEVDEESGPWIGDCLGAVVVTVAVVGRFVGQPKDMGGGVQEDGEASFEFGIVEPHNFHAAQEYVEACRESRGQRLAGGVVAERGEEVGYECVDLVVGAGSSWGKFEYPYVGGFNVEEFDTEAVIDEQDYVAAVTFGPGQIGSDQSREVAIDDFDKISFFEFNGIYAVERKTVLIGAGYLPEVVHGAVIDCGIAFGSASV